MKGIVLALVAFIAFAATLVGALAATGNLSRESIDRLMGKAPPPSETTPPVDDADLLAKQLREEREKLKERAAAVQEQEKRLQILQQDLVAERAQLAQVLADAQKALDQGDAERQQRLADVSKRIGSMEPELAAKALEGWPAEDAAAVLRQMKEKQSGAILDAMAPEKASQLLRALQEGPAKK